MSLLAPPPYAAHAPPYAAVDGHPSKKIPAEAELGDLVRYLGSSTTKEQKLAKRTAVPPPFIVNGLTYEYRRLPADPANTNAVGRLEVRCGADGAWVVVPWGQLLHVPGSGAGAYFHDPTALLDTTAAGNDGDGVAAAAVCKYKAACTNKACPAAHPFPCRFGLGCRKVGTGGCKLVHPDPASVVPLGAAYPRNQACKYGPACGNKTCHFAHPTGRVVIGRVPATVVLTHTAGLAPLATPVPLRLDIPAGATKMQLQGEFIFFFTPYPGAHAKDHFQKCSVSRANPAADYGYTHLAEYTLPNHYCNAAVGKGRHMVLSWWPFEDEAMLAIWEALRRERTMEKALKAKDAELAKLQRRADKATQVIRAQAKQVRQQDAKIAELKRKETERKARAAASYERRESEKRDQAARRAAEKEHWRKQRDRQAAARAERYRYRDPIHIWQLDGDAAGNAEADWTLVVDYHKGAHNLVLRDPAGPAGAPQLWVTEHDKVYRFELIGPDNLAGLTGLPVVPGKLCPDF